MSAGKVEIYIYQQPNYKKYGQGYRKLLTVMGVGGLTKNVSHHNWLSKIFCWNSLLKENLEQTINDSKFHICHSFFFENFISVSSIQLFLYLSTRFSGHFPRFFFNIQIFQQKVAKPAKTSENVHSFYNTVSLKKPHSTYKPQPTWNWK